MKDNKFLKKCIEILKSVHFWSGLILCAMFLALIVNIINFVSNNSYDVISDEHNPRQALLARQHQAPAALGAGILNGALHQRPRTGKDRYRKYHEYESGHLECFPFK